ncbi:MAG: hypothetical protein ACLQNE_11720 [Thermoguttaceae bacterium]
MIHSRMVEILNAPLREEMGIKAVRVARIPPHRRPLHPPIVRREFFEVKAAGRDSQPMRPAEIRIRPPNSVGPERMLRRLA